MQIFKELVQILSHEVRTKGLLTGYYLDNVLVTAHLKDEDTMTEETCTATELLDKLYRKYHKKVVRYFWKHRKTTPSFRSGWLFARAKKPRTAEPIIDELFGVGPLSFLRDYEKHLGPMTDQTRAAPFHYGRQTQLYNDCFTHAHNYYLGFYDVIRREVMTELLAWRSHETEDYINELKRFAGIRIRGIRGIYMTETEAYSYKFVFYWNPEYMG